VLLRGAGDPDHLAGHEPRLARAVALAYRLPQPPSGEQLLRLSENWRPYRTWVTLLLRTWLEDQTGRDARRGSDGSRVR
jgi:DNA-3-methyladenine glycosylase II